VGGANLWERERATSDASAARDPRAPIGPANGRRCRGAGSPSCNFLPSPKVSYHNGKELPAALLSSSIFSGDEFSGVRLKKFSRYVSSALGPYAPVRHSPA
jgi:hypothetical protein